MKRYGSIIGVHKSQVAAYRTLHRAVWPGVSQMIRRCHIRNYSIFLRRVAGRHYLFSYFEYTGGNFAADMKKMAADPLTQQWWDLCLPYLIPLPDRKKGQRWADMVEVFHQD